MEYKQLRKANTFLDKRFGGAPPLRSYPNPQPCAAACLTHYAARRRKPFTCSTVGDWICCTSPGVGNSGGLLRDFAHGGVRKHTERGLT